MRPDSHCAGCANDQHVWGPAATEPERALTTWTVRLTRRSCACPHCPCRKRELTLTARARHTDPPTTYLPLAGSLTLDQSPAVMPAPTVPRYRLPPAAMLPADLLTYRPPALPLARRAALFAETQTPHPPLPIPDNAVMQRVLKKLRELPATGPEQPPPESPP